MSLFRLLSTLTVLFVIAVELLTHLPQWALSVLRYGWIAVLVAAAYGGWQENQRARAARSERERYGLRRA